jgi:hypothetical protein
MKIDDNPSFPCPHAAIASLGFRARKKQITIEKK